MMKWIRTTVAAAAVLSMAACAGGNNGTTQDGAVNNNRDQVGPYSVDRGMRTNDTGRYDMNNWDGRVLGNPFTNDNVRGSRLGTHNNSRVELSQEMADQIAAMGDVDSAYVFLTNRNAYVAVKLDAKANQSNRRGMTDRSGGGRDGTSVTEFGATGNNSNGNANGNTRGNMNGNMNDNMNRNTMNDMDDALKQRIAAKVKSLHPNVENVYVSANPGFMQRMQGFADSIDRGRPARGFIDEFNNIVNRLFPANALNDTDTNTNNRMTNNLRHRATGTDRGTMNNFNR